MNNPEAELTDGAIFLRPLSAEDAAAHLAGEDSEMAKWVSGGRSTMGTVQEFIRTSQENWTRGGPRRALGVFACATRELIGFVEANLTLLGPGQVNISYGIIPQCRGRGLALRAVELMEQYLRTATQARQIVLCIAPENAASLRVAARGGFAQDGVFDGRNGRLLCFVRNLTS
jgi:RimJ/RimL family protein N-acetyltransferase